VTRHRIRLVATVVLAIAVVLAVELTDPTGPWDAPPPLVVSTAGGSVEGAIHGFEWRHDLGFLRGKEVTFGDDFAGEPPPGPELSVTAGEPISFELPIAWDLRASIDGGAPVDVDSGITAPAEPGRYVMVVRGDGRGGDAAWTVTLVVGEG
jgi:hypothetical protein